MANNFYGLTGLTGGTSSDLDGISGAGLAEGDGAIVITNTGFYVYVLDSDLGGGESSPSIITPNDSPGDKRWVLQRYTPTIPHLLDEQAAPTVAANQVGLYAKAVSGASELFVRKESDGAEVQVTTGGILNISSSAEGTEGKAELATHTETDAGTDDARIVTPHKLISTPMIYRKNVIINGGFRVNQRAYVSAATLAAGVYGHDRWKAGAAGGDYSFTQSAGLTTVTIATGKTLIQVVEDKNVIGGSYVLSWTGTAQARYAINSATPAGDYAASPILITGQTTGTTMSVEFNAGTVGAVQLELGSAATSFEFLPYGQELALCQRYCILPYSDWSPGQAYSTAAAYFVVSLPVAMRAAPTLSTAAGHVAIKADGNTSACTSVGVLAAGVGASVLLSTTTSSLLVAGNACMLGLLTGTWLSAEL